MSAQGTELPERSHWVLPATLLGLVTLHAGSAALQARALNASPNQIAAALTGALLLSLLLVDRRPSSSGLDRLSRLALLLLGTSSLMPLWLGVLLSLLCVAPINHRVSRWALLSLALALGFIARLFETYGFEGSTLYAIAQTHPAEILDFVSDNLTPRLAVGLLLLLGAGYAGLFQPQLRSKSARWIFAALGFSVLAQGISVTVVPLREWKQQAERASVFKDATPSNTRADDIDIVFLLGESTSRWHMGLQGYPYPTTPKLDAMREHLVVLEDAVSTYSHTVESVSSLMLRSTDTDFRSVTSLLSTLRAAAVKTRWLSTQTGTGPWDSPVTKIARSADSTEFVADTSAAWMRGLDRRLEIGKGYTADEEMVARLATELKQTPASGPHFWVAHLTASHWDYCRHLPHEAQERTSTWTRGARYFGDAPDRSAIVNCYDAAILQIDAMVSSVMEAASRRDKPTVVIYAPDHGEDPEGGTGHSAALASSKHVEIPVIFRFNAAAQRLKAKEWQTLQSNRQQRFALPWLHETILDIYGRLRPGSAERQLALTSEEYDPPSRVLYETAQPVRYDEHDLGGRKDYLSLTRLNLKAAASAERRPKHLFAFRCDSELALIEAMQYFDGVEINVFFDEKSGRFDIGHPPAKSVGLDLERVLTLTASKPKLRFWLDWKNASDANLDAALKELNRLELIHSFKHRTLIETGAEFLSEKARLVSANGFKHSYYLPSSPALATACSEPKESTVCATAAIKAAADAQLIGAECISYDLRESAFAMAVKKRAPSSCLLSWDMTLDATSPGFLSRIARNNNLDTLITRFPTPYLR